MPKEEPVFVVVVTRGRDAGARIVVGATAKVIGRSRSCDLLLSDPGVSRTHCEVTATEAGVRVVAPGGSIVVADTLLGVLPRAEPDAGNATTVGFLFSGLAADVKSLGSITALVDALDEASDEDALASALTAWAAAHAGAMRRGTCSSTG
jgi:hypothetical protein